MAETGYTDDLIIDDRSSTTLSSNLGTEWRLVTDQVMGGISEGTLRLDTYNGQSCLRLQGEVSTENNGGFIQMALDLTTDKNFDASSYSGIELKIAGNSEDYNIHLRTTDLWFPWQSYRAGFKTTSDWQSLFIPFAAFEPYRTGRTLNLERLKRIGFVAIGREMTSDLCIGKVWLKTSVPTEK
ncbi:MAG: CIA30 family protein [Deltaproteobacteria bacterium]|nr:CIA30 family protein [Deltaproteobacteria bacterium]MCW8893153.1 CIA30 family protein [Deltaproteobacteria bacterium]